MAQALAPQAVARTLGNAASWAGQVFLSWDRARKGWNLAWLISTARGRGTSLGRIRETRVVRAEVPSRTVEDGIGLLMTRRVIPRGPKV